MKTRIAKHLAYLLFVFSLSVVFSSFAETGSCDASNSFSCVVRLSNGGSVEGKGKGSISSEEVAN